MKFAFVPKHRGIWPVRWTCEALGISRSGFHAWLARPPSKRARTDEEVGARIRASFLASDRTYGARRVWRDVLGDGIACGLHKIERLAAAQLSRSAWVGATRIAWQATKPWARKLPASVN